VQFDIGVSLTPTIYDVYAITAQQPDTWFGRIGLLNCYYPPGVITTDVQRAVPPPVVGGLGGCYDPAYISSLDGTDIALNVTRYFLVMNVDIKPQGCPNPLNTKSKGVTPVAILGTADFDITDIDIASLRLKGVAAIRSAIEDVATPFTPINGLDNAYGCNNFGPDGFDDLTLKFDTQELIAALDEVQDGDVLELTLTGVLQDGTSIEGQDLVVIKAKGGGNN
jgi:hypothetical protein